MPTNSEAFLLIYNLSGHNLLLDKFMIFGANDLIFITFFMVFLLIVLGGPRERKSVLTLLLSVILVWILSQITHFFFYEPRPYLTLNVIPLIKHTPDAAFPSQHTTMMAVVAFAYIFNKSKFALMFLLAMLWVGLARIFVGVHYPLDILGGIIYAIFSTLVSLKLLNKFLKV